MENALNIARETVRTTLGLISAGDRVEFNALAGADRAVVAESKIAYHSQFKSEAHRAAVIAWQEVLDGAYDAPVVDDENNDKLAEAYETFTAGSTGFAIFVETHCGFDASRAEIKRVGERARDAAEFLTIMQNETWWFDDAH